MSKSKFGISLISLIITVIVIIILAAIVIFSGMGTPEKAQLSKVISDIDNVQTAVDQAYYGLYTEKAIAGEVWTKSQFYEAIATGELNREKLSGEGLIEIVEDNLLKINLPVYEGRKWYIAVTDTTTVKTGYAVLSPGFETNGKTYASLMDIQNSDSSGEQESEEDTPASKIQVGDYVKYEADPSNSYKINSNLTGYSSEHGNILTPESSNWRVWKVKSDGTILIIPKFSLNSFYLQGTTGFINSESILDDVCKIYANEELGVTAEDIRSLRVEDIEEVSTDLISQRNGVTNYGKTNAEINGNDGYTSGRFYVESDGTTINKAGVRATTANPVVLKQTYYSVRINYKNLENSKFSSDTYKELLPSICWLASGCIITRSSNIEYYVRSIYGQYIGAEEVRTFDRDGSTVSRGAKYGVKPLVSLKSSILKISSGDGTEQSPWKLKMK